MVGWRKEKKGGSMLDKLIEYLKNLPKEEQEKLMQVLQEEQTTEQEDEQAQESTAEEQEAEQVEESTEQTQEQTEESETTEEVQEEQTEEEKQTEEKEVQNVEEQKEEAENAQVEEEQEQPVEQRVEQSVQDTEENAEQIATDDPPAFQELLETKIELALVKAGIREDRVEAAKRLFKTEIHGLEDLEKIKELIKEFPEWQKVKKEHGKGFGIPIKENGTSLTEEEKKLKSMGIDPKN